MPVHIVAGDAAHSLTALEQPCSQMLAGEATDAGDEGSHQPSAVSSQGRQLIPSRLLMADTCELASYLTAAAEPALAFSSSTLSVSSHGASMSVRPKWP